MRQTSTDDFWGLHKNMNCSFPLNKKNGFKPVLDISNSGYLEHFHRSLQGSRYRELTVKLKSKCYSACSPRGMDFSTFIKKRHD